MPVVDGIFLVAATQERIDAGPRCESVVFKLVLRDDGHKISILAREPFEAVRIGSSVSVHIELVPGGE